MARSRIDDAATDEVLFFATPSEFGGWLKANHKTKSEQWIGFYRKASGRPSITWPESVDEALCVGWIDGLRKSINEESYKIRFTPRRATSHWSAVNIRKIDELTRAGRMLPAGMEAFSRRTEARSRRASYENSKGAKLSAEQEKRFRAEPHAWEFFQAQPPSYRRLAIWHIVSAKRAETCEQRLAKVIAAAAAGRSI